MNTTHQGNGTMKLKALWHGGRRTGSKAHSKAVAHTAVRRHAAMVIAESMAEIGQTEFESANLAKIEARIAEATAMRRETMAELRSKTELLQGMCAADTLLQAQIDAADAIEQISRRLAHLTRWQRDLEERRMEIPLRDNAVMPSWGLLFRFDVAPSFDEYCWMAG